MTEGGTRELLARWHQGCKVSAGTLVALHLDWVEARVRDNLGRHLHRIGDTRDFVQEAILDFLAYAPRFQVAPTAQLRAVFARIVENAIRDQDDRWFRSKRRALSRERAPGSDSVLHLGGGRRPVTPPEDGAARNEVAATLRLAVELLDPDDRRVILLRHWDDLDFRAVAAQIAITEEAAKKRYQRALPRLARLVKDIQQGRLDGADAG